MSPAIEKAREIYATRIKPALEPAHNGEYVAIDPDTGDYFVSPDGLEACRLARRSKPDRLPVLLRVGWGVTGTIGMGPRRWKNAGSTSTDTRL